MSDSISRRQFFRLRLSDVFGGFDREVAPSYVRPPGARADEEEFLSLCERCGQCAAACPFDVIQKLGPSAGRSEGTPFLQPAENPCHWCPDMDCVAACPSGALRLDLQGGATPIGKVELDSSACLNAQGILCDTCATACPSSVRAIRMVGRMPQLDQESCVGCGLCVRYCEAAPAALVFKRDT